jgi:hypothetical protein
MKVDLLNRLVIGKADSEFNNLSFVYLYNDILQGLYDTAVVDNSKTVFSNIESSLKKVSKKESDFSYVFYTLAQLARLLKIKAAIGISIFNNYKKHDKDGLKRNISTLKRLVKFLDDFMSAYEKQWHFENKAFGYEKQIIRLGGLKERINYTIRQLSAYINSKITKIDELEEERLPISTRYWDHNNITNNTHHNYCEIVSSGFLKEI